MDVDTAIAAAYLRATGKTTTLASTSAKYLRLFGLLKYFTRERARERGVNWNDLYDPDLSIGTVTATDTYDLDSTIMKLSDREGDFVRIFHDDDVAITDYTIVPANTLKDHFWGQNKESYSGFYCAQMGTTLVFNHKFTSTDPQFGGDIQVPCHVFPEELTTGTDELQCPDPDWLVVRAAAEYVRNDITRQNQYSNLLSEANEKMQAMKDENDGQIITIDRPWTPLSGIGSDSAWS